MLLLYFLFVAAFQPPTDKSAVEKDVTDLQGVWKVVKIEFDGKEQMAEKNSGEKIKFSRGSFVFVEEGTEDLLAEFELRPDENPKWIDVEIKSGVNKGKIFLILVLCTCTYLLWSVLSLEMVRLDAISIPTYLVSHFGPDTVRSQLPMHFRAASYIIGVIREEFYAPTSYAVRVKMPRWG